MVQIHPSLGVVADDKLALPVAIIQFPPILNSEDLARLMGRESIDADRSRNIEALPPPCTSLGQKAPRWDLMVVLECYGAFQVPLDEHVAKAKLKFSNSVTENANKKRGAPTKAERIERRNQLEGKVGK